MSARVLWTRAEVIVARNCTSRRSKTWIRDSNPYTRFSSTAGRQSNWHGQQSEGDSRSKSGAKPKHKPNPRSSNALRPITVLALCIPLGYAWRYFNSDGNQDSLARGPDKFVKYRIAQREDVSSTLAILTLEPTEAVRASKYLIDQHAPELERAILSVEVKQPLLQVARAYTLLPALHTREPAHDDSHLDKNAAAVQNITVSGSTSQVSSTDSIPHTPSTTSTSGIPSTSPPASPPTHSDNTLRILLRRQPAGEVSPYIHSLRTGSELEIRGPRIETLLPKKLNSVLFLAAGTGIAPAMRVAEILNSESRDNATERTDLSVLWASRGRDDCLAGDGDELIPSGGSWLGGWFSRWLWNGSSHIAAAPPPPPPTGNGDIQTEKKSQIVTELENLQRHSGTHLSTETNKQSMKIQYFVDEEGTFIRPADVSSLIKRINSPSASPSPSPALQREPGREIGSRLLLVSGPEGFVTFWTGPATQWVNGREVQNTEVGGELSGMEIAGWSVVRLS